MGNYLFPVQQSNKSIPAYFLTMVAHPWIKISHFTNILIKKIGTQISNKQNTTNLDLIFIQEQINK
jgi:hypothetical protein